MGAVATIDNAAPDAVKQAMGVTGGGAAAAIDFVGSPKTMEFGVNIPAEVRQARRGRALRRSVSDLDRAVPIQDDDDRGLLCGHARGFEGACCSLAGTFLYEAQFLNCAQLAVTRNWQSAFRDDALARSPTWRRSLEGMARGTGRNHQDGPRRAERRRFLRSELAGCQFERCEP